jgi:RNA polymerase sigma-70 factor (ECF subfamily)
MAAALALRQQWKRMAQEIDEVTLARARRGDHEAFRAVVVRYQRPVHAIIGRVLVGVGSRAEVDELAQETFLRIYRALPNFAPRGPGRLTKWVITIATRIALDWLRRGRAEVRGAAVPDRPAHERADDLVRVRTVASVLARAVGELPTDQRAVFLLREYHEFDYEQIADALGVEIGTVKSRLSRARLALKKTLGEMENDGTTG